MAAEEPKVGDKMTTTCAGCGEVTECTFGPNPFAEEIHGNDMPRWECESCLHESAMDI